MHAAEQIAIPGPLHARQKNQPRQAENHVRKPDGHRHRQGPLPRQADQRHRRKVVAEERQEQPNHISGRFAALARGDAQRDSHQRQHDARHRKRETAMQFHLGFNPVGPGVVHQLARVHGARGQRLGHRRRRVQRLIPGRGEAVVGLAVLAHFVHGAVAHGKLDAVVLGIGHGEGFARHGDERAFGLIPHAAGALFGRGDVGNEHGAPDRHRAGPHIAHVEDGVGEIFVENARLDFRGKLRRHQIVDDARAFANGERRQPQRSITRQPRADGRKHQHRRDHLPAGDARRPHGGDFSVARHAAQPDQNPHQHSERNGQGQHRRHGQGKQRDYGFEGRVAAAHQHFKQLVDALQEDDARGQQRAEHRAGEDLAKNVTADQAQLCPPLSAPTPAPALPAV